MKIKFKDFVCYNNKIYIICDDYLYSFDNDTYEMVLYGYIEYEGELFITAPAILEKKIYMVPYNGNTITIFDIEKEEFEIRPFNFVSDGVKNGTHSIAYTYKDEIFYMCASVNIPLFSYNVKTEKFRNRSLQWDNYCNKYGKKIEMSLWRATCIIGNVVWFTIDLPNMIMQYNIDLDTYQFWKVGDQEIIYNTINYDGENLWLSGDKNMIVKWNIETKEFTKYEGFPERFNVISKTHRVGNFLMGIYDDGYIYYAPQNVNMFVKIDTSSGIIKELYYIDDTEICNLFFQISSDEIYAQVENVTNGSVANSFLLNIKDDNIKPFGLEFIYGNEKCKIGKNAKKYLSFSNRVSTKFDCLELLIDQLI